MKNIFTLLILIGSFGLSAQTSIWDGTSWSLHAPGLEELEPLHYIIDGDDCTINQPGETKSFTVNDGFSVTINADLKVTQKLSIIGTGDVVGAIIGAGGSLNLTGVHSSVHPSFGRPISYTSSSSKLNLMLDPTTSFNNIDPAQNGGHGEISFNKPNSTYVLGVDIVFSSEFKYLINAENIKIIVNNIAVTKDYQITHPGVIFDLATAGGKVTVSNAKTLQVFHDGFQILGDLEILGGSNVLVGSDNGSINVTGNTKLLASSKIIFLTTGSIFNTVELSDNSVLYAIGGSASITHLLLDGTKGDNGNGADGDGLSVIVGKGITCSNVRFGIHLNAADDGTYTGLYDGTSEGWREMSIPFNSLINNPLINWGAETVPDGGTDTFDTKVKEQDSGYIQFYDNANGDWVLPDVANDDLKNRPFEVWNIGGSNTTIIGGNLDESHNNNYTQDLYYVEDQSGNASGGGFGWNLIPNPYLSYLDLPQVLSYNIIDHPADIETEFTIRTLKGSTYGYYTIGKTGTDLGLKDISPSQAFWVKKRSSVPIDIQLFTSNQTDGESRGIELMKKGNDDSSNYISFSVTNIDSGDLTGKSVVIWNETYSRISGETTNFETHLFATSPSAAAKLYQEFDNGSDKNEILRVKEYDKNLIQGGDFNESLFMIGSINGNYSINIDVNDLDPSYNIYLTDKLSSITVRLNDGPYSYTHDTNNEANRFEVQITTEALGESERVEASSIKLANKGNSIEFMMPSTSSIESVQFVSLNGQVVKTVQATNGQTEFDVAELNSGIYIAQLKLASGNVASYKFVK